jgi:hypothetical protein
MHGPVRRDRRGRAFRAFHFARPALAAAPRTVAGLDRAPVPPKHRRWRRAVRVFVIAFAALVALRAALPFAVSRYVNHVLGGMDNYRGEIDAVHLNLWRGAYTIDRLRVFKRGATEAPLVDMRRLDLAIQWQGLLRGRIVAEATCHHPVLHFATAPRRASEPDRPPPREGDDRQLGEDEAWTLHLDQLVPFEINRFVIRDGEIRYRDDTSSPPVDFYLTDFYLEAVNIANVRRKAEEEVLLAEIEAAGRPFGTAEFEARMRFDPLAEPLRMELDAAVRDIQLTDINDFLRANGRVDAEGGTLGIYAEFATSDGLVEGYVKTLFDRMRILSYRDIASPGDALAALWEGLVALAAVVLENQPHDRLATKVPLRGTTRRASADVMATVGNLLRNAFFTALGPAIEDSVELRDMVVVPQRAGAPAPGKADDAGDGAAPAPAPAPRREERER